VIPSYLECLREQQQSIQNQHLLSLAHKLNTTANLASSLSSRQNPNALVDFGLQFQNSQHLLNSLASLQPKSNLNNHMNTNLIELFQNFQSANKATSSILADTKNLSAQQHKLAFNYNNYLNGLNGNNSQLLQQLQAANNVLRFSQSNNINLASFNNFAASLNSSCKQDAAKGRVYI
jgi:hypothetical protein